MYWKDFPTLSQYWKNSPEKEHIKTAREQLRSGALSKLQLVKTNSRKYMLLGTFHQGKNEEECSTTYVFKKQKPDPYTDLTCTCPRYRCWHKTALLMAYEAFYHVIVMPGLLGEPVRERYEDQDSLDITADTKKAIKQLDQKMEQAAQKETEEENVFLQAMNEALKKMLGPNANQILQEAREKVRVVSAAEVAEAEAKAKAARLKAQEEAKERRRQEEERHRRELEEREKKENLNRVTHLFEAYAGNKLDEFFTQESRAGNEKTIALVPTLDVSAEYGTVELSLQVRRRASWENQPERPLYFASGNGLPRAYVIKSIKDFLSDVKAGERLEMGKDLSFRADVSAFDTESRELLNLLILYYAECEAITDNWRSHYRYLNLTRNAMLGLFPCLAKMPGHDSSSDKIYAPPIGTAQPKIRIIAKPGEKKGEILLQCEDFRNIFTGLSHYQLMRYELGSVWNTLRDFPIYVHTLMENPKFPYRFYQLLAFSPEDSRRLRPLLALLADGGGELKLTKEQWEKLKAQVLTAVADLVEISLPEGESLQTIIPEPMTGLILLDSHSNDSAELSVLADYSGNLVNIASGTYVGKCLSSEDGGLSIQRKKGTPSNYTMRRNPPEEQRLLAKTAILAGASKEEVLTRFQQGKDDPFIVSGNDALYSLLSEGIPKLRKLGEVLISEKVKRLTISQPKKAAVGVSLDSGLIQLKVDTGVPLDEYENLLKAYREKKKYYRFKDGGFMDFSQVDEDTAKGWQLLREVWQGLQVENPGEVITVPAFRAMYLDGLFSEESGLVSEKSKAFRELTNRIRGFADANYPLPDGFGKILRPYQRMGFEWMQTLASCSFGGILADDMGLGKSVQLISFLAAYYENEENCLPSLIVSPASLVLNWKAEFEKFAPHLTVRVIQGTAAAREKLISEIQDRDIVLTSYDLLKRDTARYEGKEFYCFTLDEAQYIKNHTTQAAKAVKLINCRQRFALTGTPIENRLSELWSIFDFLMPGYLYKYTRFRQQFEEPIVRGEDETARENLRRMVRPFVLRRLKGEVLTELPPKISTVLPIELGDKQMELYNATVATGVRDLAKDTGKKANPAKEGAVRMKVLALLTRLRRLCCDPSLCYEDYSSGSAKTDACIELLLQAKESGHRVLLFSQYTDMLDILEARVKAEGLTFLRLQGSTPAAQRLELVKRFNDGEGDAFLISLKAGGTGLNLTGADTVILYDPWWNNAAQEQAADRAHRIGQSKTVQVYKLIAQNTIEEKILQLQEMKRSLSEVIENGDSEDEGVLTHMNPEEIIALLKAR